MFRYTERPDHSVTDITERAATEAGMPRAAIVPSNGSASHVTSITYVSDRLA
jgi:hypothetical protein